jgi:hypothetical protein
MKTVTDQTLQIFPEKEEFMFCYYWSLCYLLVMDETGSEYLFPGFAEKVVQTRTDDKIDSKVSALFTAVFNYMYAIANNYQEGENTEF